MPGTPRPRAGAGGNACASERECERSARSAGLTGTLGGPAVPGSPRGPPSDSAPSPAPTARSPPRPAPARGPYRRAPPPPVLRRPLLLPRRPLAIAPFYPTPHPAARFDDRGDRRGQPCGEPRNPRSPPRRRRPRAGGVREPLPSGRSDRAARRLPAQPGLREASAHPREVFFYRGG